VRKTARTMAFVAIVVSAFTGVTTGTAGAVMVGDYVALGDSAASGPLIPPQDPASPGCARSLVDYPHIVAQKLGVALTDVTCSGATTADMTGRQTTGNGPVDPQLNALSAGTRLVTLTIGANDIGLVGAASGCINLLPGIQPDCVDKLTAGGHDQLAEAIATFEPRWGTLLDAIRRLAPNATIFVAEYGTYLPHNGCWPTAPMSARDANYIQATIGRLDAAMAREAAAHGARYLDILAASVGHDVCQSPQVKWFESVIPTSSAAPLHPNANGMAGIGSFLATGIMRA